MKLKQHFTVQIAEAEFEMHDGNRDASQCNVPLQIVRNEVPQALQRDVVTGISSAIGGRKGLWEVDIISESDANAWDVEIMGPANFHWARRFSGEDRDVEVISEAVRAAVLDLTR